MLKFSSIILLILISLFICNSCKQKSHRAFYYWKSVFQLSLEQKKYLNELNISKLYIRFFDVDWDDETKKAIPKAKIRFKEKVTEKFEIIPVVYITNKTFLNIKDEDFGNLLDNIVSLIDQIAYNNQLIFSEIQIDCDWTDNSKLKYFKFLEELKLKLAKNKILLSTTIRLHQIKYKNLTGVPPVNKGMLMFYNMGRITANSSANSIYNFNDASKYVEYCKIYPLPLDVVLAAYSWGIHIRNEKVLELINNVDATFFENNRNFLKIDNEKYTAVQSFFYKGYYFMKDDIVKIEDVNSQLCKLSAKQLSSQLNKSVFTVSIYHLDTLIFSKYEKEDFEKIFNTFN